MPINKGNLKFLTFLYDCTSVEDPLNIPSFAKEQPAADGVIRLQLWIRDARGDLHIPSKQERVVVSLGEDKQVTLSDANDHRGEVLALEPGSYSLSASKKCLFQVDGKHPQHHAQVEVQNSSTHQVDVILEADESAQRQTTRLIL